MNKTVLITGTSTGIGRACALHLATEGFTIYAGVRKASDGETLKNECSGDLRPILIDVTDEGSINRAAAEIAKATGGSLHALINNAGIGLGGALEVTPLSKIQQLMNVNVVGLLATTKAFIPLLRQAQGRIINIGSTAGHLAFPGGSVYSASKFAVRAITDSLRRELQPFGIHVVLISPGAIESAIWEKGKTYKEALRPTIDPDIAELYAPLRRFGDKILKDMKRIPATEVAKAVNQALQSKHPKHDYIVGKDAKGAKRATFLPASLLDKLILKRIQKLGISN